MIAVISLLIVLVVSLIVVRIASVALSMTGLSRELARFQARSAFTGAGFTTSESEKVLRHPVRRRIIMLLMLLGNAGIVTVVSSLVLSFVAVDSASGVTGTVWFRMTLLVVGMAVLWTVSSSDWVDRQISQLVTWALKRWTTLDVLDYAGLLHLSKGYVVSELYVQEGDWLANCSLQELNLIDEGVLVLGIEKSAGRYLGAPRGTTLVEPGDSLLLYGRAGVLRNLDERSAGVRGNWDHHKAVGEQLEIEDAETREEEEASGSAGRQREPTDSLPRE